MLRVCSGGDTTVHQEIVFDDRNSEGKMGDSLCPICRILKAAQESYIPTSVISPRHLIERLNEE